MSNRISALSLPSAPSAFQKLAAIMFAMSGVRLLAQRRLYDGKVLALDVDEVEEPGGVRAVREVVRHRGSVAALPVHDDGRVLLVRQYR